jgi:hypothetical protein
LENTRYSDAGITVETERRTQGLGTYWQRQYRNKTNKDSSKNEYQLYKEQYIQNPSPLEAHRPPSHLLSELHQEFLDL